MADILSKLHLLSNFNLILDAIEKQESERNHRYDIYIADYFGDPLPINSQNTDEIHVILKPKQKSRISTKSVKPYSGIRRQRQTKRKYAEPEPVPDLNSVLFEMTADEHVDTIRFFENKITQEQLEESMMYCLDLNLAEAKQFLAKCDWAKL